MKFSKEKKVIDVFRIDGKVTKFRLNAAIYKIKYETCWSSKKKDTFISLESKFDYVYNFRDTLYIFFTKLPSIFISSLKLKLENSILHRFIFKYQKLPLIEDTISKTPCI